MLPWTLEQHEFDFCQHVLTAQLTVVSLDAEPGIVGWGATDRGVIGGFLTSTGLAPEASRSRVTCGSGGGDEAGVGKEPRKT